jgi:uncharacterized protein YqgV (UPF0045/DUF77 family)
VAIRAEFTIFPFQEGNEMPAHVQAGIDAAQAGGAHVEIGPLSNTICGEPEDVLPALLAAELASVGAGATRIVVSLEVEAGVTEDHEFARSLAATLGPLYRISIVDPVGEVQASFGTLKSDRVTRTELPLSRSRGVLRVEFDLGAVEGADSVLRALAPAPLGAEPPAGSFTHVDRALAELITLAELQVGKALGEMSRAEKQQVVRFLDERGAFALRKSVETVADALGVSRFTVYNYLDSARQANGPG